MAERVRVREIDDAEGRRLLRITRRGTGSVVTWRRAQMVLLSAQGMPVAKIAEVTFTSADRIRDVIHNFNTDGFDSLYPKYKGGRPKTFTLSERREIKKIAKSKPAEHGLPFSNDARRGATPAQGGAPPLSCAGAAADRSEGRGPTAAPGSGEAGRCGRASGGGQRWSLPSDWVAARPASRRATGMRNGEQET